FGAGVSRMSSESIRQVLVKYSREGLYAALRPAGCQHLAGTRIDVLLSFEASLDARGQRPQNPLDVNSFAWQKGLTLRPSEAENTTRKPKLFRRSVRTSVCKTGLERGP